MKKSCSVIPSGRQPVWRRSHDYHVTSLQYRYPNLDCSIVNVNKWSHLREGGREGGREEREEREGEGGREREGEREGEREREGG